MAHSTISPALRKLYARQEILMSREQLSADERAELCTLPDQLASEWTKERARRCREVNGAPHAIVTGPDPRDQAQGGYS